jgi:hypothetical protein
MLQSLLLALLPGCAYQAPSPTSRAKVSVRMEVVDAATGWPIPCRASIRGEDGAWYFPELETARGSVVAYRRTANNDPEIVEMHSTASADPLVIKLAPGRYALTAERGKEYHLERRELTVVDKPLAITIHLRRWIDAAARGWYSGDTHTHRTLAELPNVMLAEDLNVAFPLIDWVREAFVAPTAKRAQSYPDPGADTIKVDSTHLIVPRNTEYEIFTVGKERHTLGAFFVLNHKKPLDLGVPPFGPVARQAHDEGALIELDKHNWPWSMALVPVMPVDLFELSNNHIWETDFSFHDWGELPAPYMNVERDAKGFTEGGWIQFGFENYYALLDCGFRLRPTAGTASGVHPVPLGFGRVYVHLARGIDARAWIDGLNAGRSFVTTGPMLFVSLDGRDPGHRFEQTAGASHEHRLSGTAESAVPLARIEIIKNGELVRTIPPANRLTKRGSYESAVDESLPIETTSWIAVRCFEDRPDRRVRFAHTGPFHIDVAGKPLRPRKVEIDYLIRRVEEQIARSSGVIPESALAEYRVALSVYHAIAKTAR